MRQVLLESPVQSADTHGWLALLSADAKVPLISGSVNPMCRAAWRRSSLMNAHDPSLMASQHAQNRPLFRWPCGRLDTNLTSLSPVMFQLSAGGSMGLYSWRISSKSQLGSSALPSGPVQ